MATFERLWQQLGELRQVNGITPVDILQLPEELHGVVRKMVRQAVSLQELSAELMLPLDQTHLIADLLVAKGFLRTEDRVEGDFHYRILFARMHTHHIPLDL